MRTVALRSIFLMAVAVAGRMGTVELAAYQIGIGVWTFLAFAYDGIETAGQALVAREVGRPAERRGAIGSRTGGGLGDWCFWSCWAVTVLGHRVLAGLFSADDVSARRGGGRRCAVVGRLRPADRRARLCARRGARRRRRPAVSGRGDAGGHRHLRGRSCAYPEHRAGLWALWATLLVSMAVRTALMSRRFRSGAWVRAPACRPAA